MRPHQMNKRFWILVLVVVLTGLIVTACGNEPTPSQVAAVPTNTPPPPPPTDTSTPEPTATMMPSPTSAPTDTPAPPTPTATEASQSPPSVTAVEGNVNLRLGPDTGFEAVGLLEAGSSLEIIGRNEDSSWFQVTTDEGPRWIAAEVTEAQNVSDAIPVVEPDEEVAVQPTDPPPPTATPEDEAADEATPTPEVVTCTTMTVTAPLAGDTFNTSDLTVRWRCDGDLPPDHSFEVKLWLAGETPLGAHDAINDAPNILRDGEDYVLMIPVTGAAGFRDINQEYAIAVSLVEIAPEYEDTGLMSEPVLIRFE